MIPSSGIGNVPPKSDVDDPPCELVNKRGVLTTLANVDPDVVQPNRTLDAGMNKDVGEVMKALKGEGLLKS